MNIEILHDQCLSCECCIAACRRYIFKMGDKGKIELDQEQLPLCMHCGHCAAVCPGAAIELDNIPSADLPELPTSLKMLGDNTDLLLKSKRSTGAYSSRKVPQEVLEKALDAANYAPSARGAHPVQWLVINSPEKREAVLQEILPFYATAQDVTGRQHYRNHQRGVDSLLRYAPCVLIAHAPRHLYGESDCVTAITYASLALHAQGLGSCWAGSIISVSRERQLQSLPMPQGHVAYAALLVGYPDINFLKLPHRPAPVIRII